MAREAADTAQSTKRPRQVGKTLHFVESCRPAEVVRDVEKPAVVRARLAGRVARERTREDVSFRFLRQGRFETFGRSSNLAKANVIGDRSIEADSSPWQPLRPQSSGVSS